MTEKHAPITKIRVSEKYWPWIDHDLEKLICTRDRLKKAAAKRKSSLLMDSYWHVHNEVRVLSIELKKQYDTNKISACQGNMKESWKAINELLSKRSKSSNTDCLIESVSETVHKKGISNATNSFFCTVGKDLTDKIDAAPNFLLAGDYAINKRKTIFHFRTIEVQEIRDAFATLRLQQAFELITSLATF